ncbi:MAG: hypothetical protein KA146_04790, partial [Leptospiraceae bacterium]|nr:hypothetical protein [Leptospiraceae bacterium]
VCDLPENALRLYRTRHQKKLRRIAIWQNCQRKPFKDKYKYPFTFYTLPNSFDEYEIHAIPTTYILNSKNEILYSKVGDIDWSKIKY